MAVLNLDLTLKQMPAKYPALPLTALALDFVFTAAGASFADGAEYTCTGKEIVLVGGGAAGGTVTVTSVKDEYNRTGDISVYSIGVNLFSVLPQLQPTGFKGANGKVKLTASVATVTFAVLRLTD